jgi:hypothetical protein
LHSAAAFSTATAAPEITVCPGEFRFAAATGLYGAYGVGKRQRPGSHVRRPFTQGMSSCERRRDAMFSQNAERRHTNGHDGRLRVLGQLQVFFGALNAELRQGESAGFIGFGKGLSGHREPLG